MGGDVTVIPSTIYDLQYDGWLQHTMTPQELNVRGWLEATSVKELDMLQNGCGWNTYYSETELDL